MTENNNEIVSFISNDEMEERIQIVLRQTDYTIEEVREKLTKHGFDAVKCIKEYLGIDHRKPIQQEKQKQEKSVNQQIYTELRKKLEITKEIKAQVFRENT